MPAPGSLTRVGVGGAFLCFLALTGFFRIFDLTTLPMAVGPWTVDLLSAPVLLAGIFLFVLLAMVDRFLLAAAAARRLRRDGNA